MSVKKSLKKVYWRLSDKYLAQMGPSKFVKRSSAAGRHVVILTPSDVGNLGDEAMVTSVVSQLRDDDPKVRITLITHLSSDAVHYDGFNVETVCLEGFFSKVPSLAACERLGKVFETASDFILLGADILDGKYSETRSFRRLFLARQAERAGLAVYVLGFSFSDKAVPAITKYMRRECSNFGYLCRDPLSAKRVSDVVEKPVNHGADLAFLLPIPSTPVTDPCKRAAKQIEAWRAEGREIVAVNTNPLGLIAAFPEVDLKLAAANIASGLNIIASETNCVFLFLTHDNRPGHSDAKLTEQVLSTIDPSVTYHCVPETIKAVEIKYLCQRVDLTVTGRMHLGIASLGAGSATMILDFQGKVRGLFDLFGLPHMALDVNDVMKPEVFSKTVIDRLSRHTEISTAVKNKLDEIHSLSRRNMALLFAEIDRNE